MNWERRIEHLAARARAEEPPRVDVARSVLGILSGERLEPISMAERLWMWLAAASAAVAVPAAVVAGIAYRSATGPLREIVDSISWAM